MSEPNISCVYFEKIHGEGHNINCWDTILLDENLSYEDESIAILD